MIRNGIRGATILLAALASAAVMLVTPLPAFANGNHLCETYGPHYCLGSTNLNVNTPVFETTPGRDLFLTQQAGSFDGYPIFVIQFGSDVSKCVAATYASGVFVGNCGGTGTVWARITDSSNVYRWINRYASQHNPFGFTEYLTGFGLGVDFDVRPYPPPPGSGQLQRFSWQ